MYDIGWFVYSIIIHDQTASVDLSTSSHDRQLYCTRERSNILES